MESESDDLIVERVWVCAGGDGEGCGEGEREGEREERGCGELHVWLLFGKVVRC